MFQYSLRTLLFALCASAIFGSWLRAEVGPLLKEEAAIQYWEKRMPSPSDEFNGPGWGICWHYHRPWWVRCLGLTGFRRAYALSFKHMRFSEEDIQKLIALEHLCHIWVDGKHCRLIHEANLRHP